MTLCEVLKNCVLHTLSHAWQLGRAICRAKQSPCNIIIESIVNQQQGLLLLTGEVSMKRLVSNVSYIYILVTSSLFAWSCIAFHFYIEKYYSLFITY